MCLTNSQWHKDVIYTNVCIFCTQKTKTIIIIHRSYQLLSNFWKPRKNFSSFFRTYFVRDCYYDYYYLSFDFDDDAQHILQSKWIGKMKNFRSTFLFCFSFWCRYVDKVFSKWMKKNPTKWNITKEKTNWKRNPQSTEMENKK